MNLPQNGTLDPYFWQARKTSTKIAQTPTFPLPERNPAWCITLYILSHYVLGFIHPTWLAGFLNHQQYHTKALWYVHVAQGLQRRSCKRDLSKKSVGKWKIYHYYTLHGYIDISHWCDCSGVYSKSLD